MSENLNQNIEATEDPQFSKGFNNGYIIAQHEPELSKALVVSLQNVEPPKDNMYAEGIKEGILHHELEKVKERYKGYQSPDRGQNHDKDKGRTKD